MCNQHRLTSGVAEIAKLFDDLSMPLGFPEGAPNVEPREVIAITDPGPIVRPGEGGLALVQRRWSWKGPTGAPVFNFRSEGRRFARGGRCAIPTDGFYEFTTPEDPRQKRKDRWLFTMAGQGVFFIAGVVRDDAWAMLTCEPGTDMAPFHSRQVVVLSPREAVAWLGGGAEAELLRPAEAGTLAVERSPAS
jgi:putative SOS response-associated peptidase YedK